MNLSPHLAQRYTQEHQTANQAQRLAQEIAFAPIVFQVSRLMLKYGILAQLSHAHHGLTRAQIAQAANISDYAAQVLLEASLSIGTVLTRDDRFFISKAGWFLLNDKMARVNMDFVQEICYQGLFDLDATLQSGKPEGLKVFGDWATIYEGLSSLPPTAREKWLAFDHHYSDSAFQAALNIVFAQPVQRLLDVGGNTGRWALQCVAFNPDVNVTIMDLPQQLGLMREAVRGKTGAERIHGYAANLLDEHAPFPTSFDAIWMSQFLDCFSAAEATSILRRAAQAMSDTASLFIMEPLWDRQRYETATYCLTMTSVYFTAMANGNSKIFHSADLLRCIENAGLAVAEITDGIGLGHSILRCVKAPA